MISQSELSHWFRHHPPTPAQVVAYEHLRKAAGLFAELVVALTPPSADQTAAVRKIREAVMTANAAVACDETGHAEELEDLARRLEGGAGITPRALPTNVAEGSLPVDELEAGQG